MNEQLRLVEGDDVVQPIVELDACVTCEQCGEQFPPRARSGGKSQRFCSSQCRQRWHNANPNVAQRSGPHVGTADGGPHEEPSGKNRTSEPPSGAEDVVWARPPKVVAPNNLAFNWVDDDAVVLTEQPATAIYRNRENAIVIRQQASWDSDEDSFIFITEQNAMTFLDRLCDLLGICEFGGPRPAGAPKQGTD
jgi:hypothetical protein